MSTEKQRKCIYALCKEKGIAFDEAAVAGMTKEQASRYIDELKGPPSPPEPDTTFNHWRFGMCVKLVLEHGMSLEEAIGSPVRFREAVHQIYALIDVTERELAGDNERKKEAGSAGSRFSGTARELNRRQWGG